MDQPAVRSDLLKARLLFAAAILVALVAGWLFGAGGLERLVRNTTSTTSSTADVGQPAPQFSLASAAGPDVRLADYRGQVVLVNFWATWCEPCRTEMPAIDRVYRQQQGRGFEVLAVDVEEGAGQVQTYQAELGLSFPALLDADGTVSRSYRARGLPTSFLVDRQGTIRFVKVGALDEDTLTQQLDKLL